MRSLLRIFFLCNSKTIHSHETCWKSSFWQRNTQNNTSHITPWHGINHCCSIQENARIYQLNNVGKHTHTHTHKYTYRYTYRYTYSCIDTHTHTHVQYQSWSPHLDPGRRGDMTENCHRHRVCSHTHTLRPFSNKQIQNENNILDSRCVRAFNWEIWGFHEWRQQVSFIQHTPLQLN